MSGGGPEMVEFVLYLGAGLVNIEFLLSLLLLCHGGLEMTVLVDAGGVGNSGDLLFHGRYVLAACVLCAGSAGCGGVLVGSASWAGN